MKKKENYIINITSYLIVFLFTYTACSKLMDHASFLTSLLQSPIIRNYATIISWLIPILELLIVVMLLTNKYKIIGLWFSLFLMVIFTIYIAYMILYIPHLPCSCGGVLKELSWQNHLLFNGAFIILVITSLLINYRPKLFIAINRRSRKPV